MEMEHLNNLFISFLMFKIDLIVWKLDKIMEGQAGASGLK